MNNEKSFFAITTVLLLSNFMIPINDAYAAVDTWTDATTTNVGTTIMRGVSMSDANNGVAVGDSGTMVFTTNGGVDWTAATTTNVGTTNMMGVSMSDASNGVAVGVSGQIVFADLASSEESATDTTKKSGSECNDCTAPSIGISQNHRPCQGN